MGRCWTEKVEGKTCGRKRGKLRVEIGKDEDVENGKGRRRKGTEEGQ